MVKFQVATMHEIKKRTTTINKKEKKNEWKQENEEEISQVLETTEQN